jgi:hypothetical protein
MEPLAADGIGEPSHNGFFDGYGSGTGAPGGDILIEDTTEQIGDRPDRLSGAENVSEEPGILRARVPGNVSKLIQRFGAESGLVPRTIKLALSSIAGRRWHYSTLIQSTQIVAS